MVRFEPENQTETVGFPSSGLSDILHLQTLVSKPLQTAVHGSVFG
jgi:hypothetical protein